MRSFQGTKTETITDVYEYIGGRPQLISGALASRDFTGESEVLGLFAKPETTGLEAVSRDGTMSSSRRSRRSSMKTTTAST